MALKNWILIIFLFLQYILFAQIPTVKEDFFNSSTSYSWTHTTTNSPNKILFVFITTGNDNGTASDIKSVKYGEIEMTRLAAAEFRASIKSYLYFLLSPPPGINTVSVTPTSNTDLFVAGSASYFNVDQNTPSFSINGGNATSASGSISTPFENNLLLAFCGAKKNITCGTGQVEKFIYEGSPSTNYVSLSTKTSTGITTSFGITIASTSDYELIISSLKPIGSALLPVDLSKYQLSCKGGKVMLDWTTDSELNNDYFTVEKSQDCRVFEPIANITGNGTTTEMIEYFYVDEEAIEGIMYYRLKQTDYNGNTKTYSPLSARCEKESPEILMYPNPNHGIFSVHFPDYNNDVIILNSAGKVIYKQFISSNQSQFNIEEVPSGIYHLMSHSISGNKSVNFRKD